MELSFSLDTIHEAATSFWAYTPGIVVFAFHGEMGAGKTTFIRALCEAKGVKGHISSPTFSIINEYEYDCEGTKRVLFHMDLYRLKDEEEAIQAGVEDCLYSGNICLVEWPQKAPGIFPPGTAHVYIEAADSATRRLRIERK